MTHALHQKREGRFARCPGITHSASSVHDMAVVAVVKPGKHRVARDSCSIPNVNIFVGSKRDPQNMVFVTSGWRLSVLNSKVRHLTLDDFDY